MIRATLFFCSVITLTGCMRNLAGNGNFINDTRTVGNYNALETDGAFDVILTNDTTNSIQIYAESNILPEIATDVQGGALIVGYTNDLTNMNHGDVQIKIPARNLKSVSLAGSGSIVARDTMRGENLDVFLLGSGKIQLLLNGAAVATDLSGSGDVTLKGRVNSHRITLSGSGKVLAYDLPTSITKINITGSGDAEVDVSQILEATIGGSGTVRYEGTPAVTSSITGAGKVKPR